MLKSLFPQINWDIAKVVGFDMDGTLYDELDFIRQVYIPISRILASAVGEEQEAIYNWMVQRWLEKGSSYNRIFDEVLLKGQISNLDREEIISKAIITYRSFVPNLKLSQRVILLLNYFSQHYPLFLVSDGNSKLQLAKFDSLGLSRWFSEDNVLITGKYGSEYYKPSISYNHKISCLKGIEDTKQVVFFGDRQIDQEYAIKAGFQFSYVKAMF